MDSSPETSPMSMGETRQRLHKLLNREKALRSHLESTSKLQFTVRDQVHQENIPVESRSFNRSDDSRNNAKSSKVIEKKYSFNTRISSMSNDAINDEEVLLQGIDSNKLDEISQNIQELSNEIVNTCINIEEIKEKVEINKDLVKLGIICMQLWMVDNSGGLSCSAKDNYIRRSIDIKTSTALLEKTSLFSLLIDSRHELWVTIENAVRSIDPINLKGTFRAIHVIPLPVINANSGKIGLLIAPELLNLSIPLAITRRPSYENATKIRQLFAVKCVEKVAGVISMKMKTVFDANFIANKQDENSRYINNAFVMEEMYKCSQELSQVNTVHEVLQRVLDSCINIYKIKIATGLWASGDGIITSGSGDSTSNWISIFTTNSSKAIQINNKNVLINRIINHNFISMAPLLINSSTRELTTAGLFNESDESDSVDMSLIAIPIMLEGWNDHYISTSFERAPSSRCSIVLAFPPIVANEVKDRYLNYAESIKSICEKQLHRVYKVLVQTNMQRFATIYTKISNTLYQPEATTDYIANLFNIFQSKDICQLFHAKKVALIMTNTVLNSATNSKDHDGKLILFHGQSGVAHPTVNMDIVLRKLISIDTEDINTIKYLWMTQLMSDNVVSLDKLNFRNSESSESSSDYNSLRKIIFAIDQSAQSVVLVPVRSLYGLSILVLINRVPYESRCSLYYDSIPGLSGEHSILNTFTPIDCELIKSSNISSQIGSLIDCAVRLQLAYAVSNENNRYKNQLNNLADMVSQQRKKQVLTKHWSKWNEAITWKQSAKGESFNSSLLMATVDLLKVGSNIEFSTEGSDNNGSIESFLQHVEDHASKLFPADAVIVGQGDAHTMHQNAMENIIVVNPETIITFSGSSHNITSNSLHHKTARPILVGYINYLCYQTQYQTVALNGGTTNTTITPTASTTTTIKTIGTIKITRPCIHGMIKQFSALEINLLKQYCDIVSVVYSSLRNGMKADLANGNFNGLILPYLSQLLPLILDLTSKDAADIKAKLPIAALWMKKLTGADVALVRLLSSAITSNNSNIGEVVISSEDANSNEIVISKDVKALHSLISRLVYDDSSYVKLDHSIIDSLNTDLINLKLHKDSDSSVIGEVKIVGSHDGAFYNDQNMAVQLISYVIAHMFSVSKRIKTAEEIGLRATEVARALELNLNNNLRELTIEKATAVTLKNRLTSILSLVVLIGQCLETTTIGSIASVINDTLPTITGAKSAGLLILENTSTNSLYFSVVAPDGSKKGTITYDQLLQIPSFKDDPMAHQSKIMIGQTGVRALGAILLFRNIEESTDSLGVAREKSLWSGLEDILVGSINSALVNCITKFTYNDMIDQLRKESNNMIHLIDQNKRENIKLLEQKSSSDLTLSKFEHEIDALTETLKLNEEMHRNVSSSLNERIATLEVDLAEEVKQNSLHVSSRHDLTALVMSYSFDHRSHHDAVYQWLTDFASTRNTKVYTVAQEEGGTLAANSASIIRGIVAAAGEALRTNNIVEIFTNYSGSGDTSNKFMLSSNVTCNVVALVVPNRFASPQSQSQSRHDHACFVFCRGCRDKNDGFNAYDKEIFSAASALAARSLFHSKSKHSVDDIVSLEDKFSSLISQTHRSQQVVSICENLWQRSFVTKVDVTKAMETAIVSLFTRGESDHCAVKCSIIFPFENVATTTGVPSVSSENTSMYQVLSSYGLAGEIEIVHTILSRGESYRKGGIMWCPLKGGSTADVKYDIAALIRIERKFNENLDNLRLGYLQVQGSGIASPTISDLVFIEEEEHMLNLFSRLAYPMLDRVKYFAEAYAGVNQAGQAIVALQGIQNNLESKLSIEISQRLQLEDALKSGAMLLGSTSSMRYSRLQLLDNVKKAIISLTSSIDCYIIMPNTSDVFTLIPHSMHHTSDENFPDSDPNNLFTLDTDRPQPVRVRLEISDLEAVALQMSKAIIAPGNQGVESEHGMKNIGQSWQSWVVRRLQGQLLMTGEDKALHMDNTYSLAVPFVLKDGSRGVASLVRRQSPYTAIDRECITWITRIFAYCMEVRGGDETVQEKTVYLTKEVERLRLVDRRSASMELDTDNLERDLLISISSNSGISTTGYVDTDASKSELYLEHEDALQAILQVCKNSFGNNNVHLVDADVVEPIVHKLENEKDAIETKKGKDDKDRRVATGTIQSVNGKILYWSEYVVSLSGISNASVKYLDVFSDGNLYLNIQQKGFPNVWIHVVLENHNLVQLRLRLIILLKLLDQLEKHSLTLRQLNDLKSTSSNKLSDQLNVNRICDYISTSTLAICNSLREEVRLTPSYGKNSSAFAQSNAWLRQSLLKLCESMSILTSSDVGVGALSIVQSKDNSGLVTANYGVTWFTNEPEVTWAAGSGYGRQSAYPTNEPIFNIERSNPIHLAMSNKAIVFISSQVEDEVTLSSAVEGITKIVNQTYISSMQKRNIKTPSIMMAPPSNGYTYGTLVIPVYIQSKNSTIIVVVKPPQDKSGENATIDNSLVHKINSYTKSTEVISTMITSWFFLCSCIEDCVEIREDLLALYRTEKLLGLQTLQKVIQSRKLLENGFLRFKIQSLGKKLHNAYGESSMLTLAKAQIRTQEQVLADWTEIVKGLNSAAASSVSMSGISNGVVGFWTNACRILSSLMASYISLQSCNLYLINAEGDPIELTMRELSTPNQKDELFSPSYDYASGSIEVRMVDGLSDRIGSIVVDLLSNSSQRNKEKIIRMTRQDTDVSANMHLIEEQIWLIPIRTARNILGVLRVTVQVPVINTNVSAIGAGLPTSSEYLPHHSTPRNILRHKNDSEENSQYNNKLRLDSAQTCAINFSEVIAPLLFAAATIDKQKNNLKSNDESHQKLLLKQKSTVLELSNTVKSTSLLSHCLTALGDIMSRDPSNNTNIRSLCTTIATVIGNTIEASVTIHLNSADGDSSNDTGVETSTKGLTNVNHHREYKTATETLVHPVTGKNLGTLSISVEVLANAKYGLNFDVDSDIINTSFEAELNTAALHIRGLESAGNGVVAPSNSAYQFEQISTIIKPLGRILSGIIVSGSREYDSKLIVNILQEKVTQSETLEHMYSLVDFYRAVASVVNQCLVFIAETDDPHSTSFKGVESIHDRLMTFLHQLCVKLPTLLLSTNTQSSKKSSTALFGFAFDFDESLTNKTLKWVYADKSSKKRLRHELTDNLARSCISTGVKSAVDIRFDDQLSEEILIGGTASRERQLQYTFKSIFPDGVRVLTYPLLGHQFEENTDQSQFHVLGVMQVLLDLSTSYSNADMDDLLDDISHAVGCTLHEHKKRIKLYQYVSDKQISENDKLMWQEYAKSWRGISLAQASVTNNCAIMSSMAEVLDVDAVQAPLVNTGLAITVKSNTNPQLFVPSKSNISLDDANTTYAEISVRNPHINNNVYESEMIDALTGIIRSGLSVCKIRTEDINSTSKRMGKIMKESEKYKSDLRLTQLELASLHKNYDSLRVLSSTTITSLCVPSVLELAAILSNTRINNTNIWDHLYHIADRAVNRIGDNNFKYHLSVLIKEPDTSEDANNANNMSIYSKNTSQRPILCRMFDGDRSRHGNGQTILSISTQVQTNVMKSIMMAQPLQESVVIKTFKSGDVHESVASTLTADVIGIDEQYLSSLVASAVTDGDDSSVSVLCFGLTDENGAHLGMIRIVYLNGSTATATTREHGDTDSTNARSLLRPVLNLVAQMTGTIISYIHKRSALVALSENRLVAIDDSKNKLVHLSALLDRSRRIHSIVTKECHALLDPAILESNLSLGLSSTPYRSIHPASLSPLVALQDTCMKLLNMSRTLLQTEGQAILLQDTSSTPTSYQVICTGNAISWSGVQPGMFGLVSATTETSLTEVCIATQKTIVIADALADLRYGSILDGACVAGTPLLVVPLRGNGGNVIGVMIIARGCTSPIYSAEDVIAAEMISSLGSIALYWVNGIKPIHSQLNQNSLQIEQLEKAVKTLSKKIKK